MNCGQNEPHEPLDLDINHWILVNFVLGRGGLKEPKSDGTESAI